MYIRLSLLETIIYSTAIVFFGMALGIKSQEIIGLPFIPSQGGEVTSVVEDEVPVETFTTFLSYIMGYSDELYRCVDSLGRDVPSYRRWSYLQQEERGYFVRTRLEVDREKGPS